MIIQSSSKTDDANMNITRTHRPVPTAAVRKTVLRWCMAAAMAAPLLSQAQTAESTAPASHAIPAIQSKILMRTQTSWDGKPLQFKPGTAEMSALYIEIAPGQQTGWHQHPVPNFAYLLEGELEVSLKDGRSNHVKAGEALAEVVNVMHNGRNPSSTTPAKLVVFYMGALGIPLTIAEPATADK